MGIIRGRIVETWERDGVAWLELIAGDDRHPLCAAPGVTLGVGRGDVVALTVDAQARVTAVHRLCGPSPGAWDAGGDALRWRGLGATPSRMRVLRQRDRITRAIRAYFHEQDFLELQTPLLVRGTCPEPQIQSFSVGDRYLVASTEYQLKRLLTGGFERVFTLTQNFRAGELGLRHNPEFTMLEWARGFETLAAIERDVQQLVCRSLAAVQPGADAIRFGDHVVRIRGVEWPRISVREALGQHLGMEVAADFSLPSVRSECLRTGQPVPEEFLNDRNAMLSLIIDGMAPMLGTRVPVFLCDWPGFMTTSAAASGPATAARTELFIAGVEISDGFPARTDPAAQRAAFDNALTHRREAGTVAVDLDAAYLTALEQGLPPAAGMALGVDRLAMVLLNEPDIRRVLPFAWDEL